jgi:xanthine/uracil permease
MSRPAISPKPPAGARETIQVDQKVPFLKGIPLSLQHLFAMFGASWFPSFSIKPREPR